MAYQMTCSLAVTRVDHDTIILRSDDGDIGIAVLGAIELTRFSHKMPAVALLGLFIGVFLWYQMAT